MIDEIPTVIKLKQGKGKNKWKIIAIVFGIILLLGLGFLGYGLFNSIGLNSYNQGVQDSFATIYNTITQNGYSIFNINNKEIICHENIGEV